MVHVEELGDGLWTMPVPQSWGTSDGRLVTMTTPTAASRSPRIRRWYWKVVYVVVAAILVYLIAAVPVGVGGAGVLRSVLGFVLILIGARLFRGPDEDVAPPRARWRMTAGVLWGVVLGAVCAVIAIVSVVGYVGLTTSALAHKDVVDLPALLVTALLTAVLAYLYFGSSRRLVLARRAKALADARGSR
jgi:uncharacterized membrane protein YfcA